MSALYSVSCGPDVGARSTKSSTRGRCGMGDVQFDESALVKFDPGLTKRVVGIL